MCQSTHKRDSRRREKGIKYVFDETVAGKIWWNYSWKLSKPKEGIRHPDTESTEGSKQETNPHQDIL